MRDDPRAYITPFVREVVVGCYARSGVWPETARLIFKTAMPASLKHEAEAARERFVRTGEVEVTRG